MRWVKRCVDRFTNDRQVGRWMKGPTDKVKNRWAYEKIKGWIG